jgi:hypothetical protein
VLHGVLPAIRTLRVPERELWAQHIEVFTILAYANVDDHAFAVGVFEAKESGFRSATQRVFRNKTHLSPVILPVIHLKDLIRNPMRRWASSAEVCRRRLFP